jgi:hypothetical protein
MSVVFIISVCIVSSMPFMHEDMHKGTEQKNQIGQGPKEMGPVLVPQEESANDYDEGKDKVIDIQGALLFICHDTPPLKL